MVAFFQKSGAVLRCPLLCRASCIITILSHRASGFLAQGSSTIPFSPFFVCSKGKLLPRGSSMCFWMQLLTSIIASLWSCRSFRLEYTLLHISRALLERSTSWLSSFSFNVLLFVFFTSADYIIAPYLSYVKETKKASFEVVFKWADRDSNPGFQVVCLVR